MKSDRALDLICLGRAAVDLYGEQIGSPLEDVRSFSKSLGGCAANVAVGAARQGLRTAMLTRVGDEHMGRFVRAELSREKVDVSHVSTDPHRLTGLVLLSIRGKETFPLIFYRESCADMALSPEDFEPEFIASAHALLLTGTHLSTPEVERTSRAALEYARRAGTKVVLDIDYRPVLWRLTGHGCGEARFVPSEAASRTIGSVLGDCDLVVGTEEEIRIAGGSASTIEALAAIRRKTPAMIVMKRGPLGCTVFEGEIPRRVEDGVTSRAVEVEVLNVLGAGDAFMSGFLRGWLAGEPLERACAYANAAGALVVSRHACSPAMPTREELDDYLARAGEIRRIDRDERIRRLHRVTARPPAPRELAILAFDHRDHFERAARSAGAPSGRIARLKSLIAEGGRLAASDRDVRGLGMIIDADHGAEALERMTASGWWLARPIEVPHALPLELEGEPNVELALLRWPIEHVVKVLVLLHPEQSAEVLRVQEERIVRLARAVEATDRELLLEVVPRIDDRAPVDPARLPEILARLYRAGVRPDWWKLPPLFDEALRANVEAIVEAEDPHCRGILVLGLDSSLDELDAAFRVARRGRTYRGFAVGRAIFAAPADAWLRGELRDDELVSRVAEGFRAVIARWERAARTA